MKKDSFSKLEAITTHTLIVGLDITKRVHWARFTDYRGLPLGKVLRLQNKKEGFESILTRIKVLGKGNNLDLTQTTWIKFSWD